jgi:hypothetical protein
MNYTAGPLEPNASAPFSLASLGVTFTIKQQGMCGDCYAGVGWGDWGNLDFGTNPS